MFAFDDTIAAVASAPGGAARGIVRISGPKTVEILRRCFRPISAVEVGEVQAASMILGNVVIDQTTLPVDLFQWPASRSFTRESLAEIHTFGSMPLLDSILHGLCSAGVRLAQPGEFTLRAFLAGRIDLTQAEAVLGVIDAADRKQLDIAVSQLAGGLSRPFQRLRDELLTLLADLEAGLDFVEEDITFISRRDLESRLKTIAHKLEYLEQGLNLRATEASLPRVVLVGQPNAGKSSLFNALQQQSAAIVSATPGTTRDYLTAQIDAAGLLVELIDTAGQSTNSSIDQRDCDLNFIEVKSASAQINLMAHSVSVHQQQQADLRLICIDATRALTSWEGEQIVEPNSMIVLTKCDQSLHPQTNALNAIYTSSKTGAGLDLLRAAIKQALLMNRGDAGAVAATSARIFESVRNAGDSIDQAIGLSASNHGEELIASELRTALTELGKIVGAIYTDDILDRIFSRFCIGK